MNPFFSGDFRPFLPVGQALHGWSVFFWEGLKEAGGFLPCSLPQNDLPISGQSHIIFLAVYPMISDYIPLERWVTAAIPTEIMTSIP